MVNYVNLGVPGHGYKLRFWEYLNTENGFDLVQIQIQQAGGRWGDIAVYSGNYTGMKSFFLDKYSGDIKIRFVFSSDWIYEYEGWYIDDIEISKDSPWEPLNPQIPNPYVTDIYFYDDGALKRLYATTISDGGSNYGFIYSFDGSNWTELGDRGVAYLSIDGPPYGYSGTILVGTSGEGVYSFNGSNFLPWCGEVAPASDFISVSVDNLSPFDGPHSAITNSKFYKLNSNCNPAYEEYSYDFAGRGLSVLSNCNSATSPSFYAGTNGLGLLSLNCSDIGATPTPVGNESPSNPFQYIKSKNVSKLAIAYNVSAERTTIFASSRTDGLYKSVGSPYSTQSDYFVRYFYNPLTEGTTKGTCLAIVPDYDESGAVSSPGPLTVYLGTEKEGIFLSNDGGASWEKTSFPDGFEVVDMVLNPQFFTNPEIYALTRDGKLFFSANAGTDWFLSNDFGIGQPNFKAYDLEISPFLDYGIIIFAATSGGLYKYSSLYGWMNVLSIPSLSVSVSPLFGYSSANPEVEGKTVLVGTEGNGLYYSINYGNLETFSPAFSSSSPLYYSDIPLVRMHNRYDVNSISGENLYTIFLSKFKDINPNEGIYQVYFSDNQEWIYSSISGGGLYNDFRISDIQFHPYFSRDAFIGEKSIYLSHSGNKIYMGEYNSWNWALESGFYHTPPFIYSISESPEDPNFVLAGTKGYGPMFYIDGGLTYFPFGSLKVNDEVLHNVPSVSITHSTGSYKNLIATASDPISGDFGIYYSNYNTGIPFWQRSYLCLPPFDCTDYNTNCSQGNFDGHYVSELRYTNLSTDIEAADFNRGPLMSDPNLGGSYGICWQLDTPGPDMPENICDISYPMSLGLGRDSKASWVWGVSGFSHSLRATTPGAYKWTSLLGWSLKNGSGAYELPSASWRAVWSISEEEVLIGSGMADGVGVYKTKDSGMKWFQSNNGLDSSSKIVKAFTGNENYIFVALEEKPPELRSGTGTNDGGVYMSDCQSKGYAWVPYSEGLSCNSVYELSAGSRIYTGSTCDGIYSLTSAEYTGNPEAYFSFEKNNPWNEKEVNFYDRSAGLCTSNCLTCPNAIWLWSGDDGFFSASQNPSHNFLSSGSKLIYLYVERDSSYSDSYSTSIFIPEVTTLKIEKDGLYPKLKWERLAGDESLMYNYKIYRSNSPDGGVLTNLINITPPNPAYCDSIYCWYTDTGGTGSVYYYRIFTED